MFRKITARSKQFIVRIPKKRVLMWASAILIVVLLVTSFWPRTVVFSYSQTSCTMQVLLAPGTTQSRGSDFSIEPRSRTVATTSACVTPLKTPQEGTYHAFLSFFGLPIGVSYTIIVPKAPVVSARASTVSALPVTKQLTLKLDQLDTVFSYTIAGNGRTAACKANGAILRCAIPDLQLRQGADYLLIVRRQYKEGTPTTALKVASKTLTATSVTDTTIKGQAVVYDKPKSLTVTFDKPVTSAVVTLARTDGDKKEKKTAVTYEDATATVSWDDDLDRSAAYQLRIDKVVAHDGSSLVEPYIVPFTVSGGPKVTGVSVKSTGAALGSTAVISFDQTLSPTQDISRFVTLGGGASLVGKSGNQIKVSLASVAKCGDYTIKFTGDIASNYDISGQSAWSFSGRMTCYSTGAIGYSAKGRAIMAYYFGSGATTVLYTGAIHGNEVSTRSLMLAWIDELEANARSIPSGVSVVVVPAINPDGVAAGTRTNGRNIDLNRNFATSDWKSDITTVNNTPFPGGGGTTPMSEPETQAIAGLVAKIKPKLVLSYHSVGGVLAANTYGVASAYATTYARLSGYSNVTGSDSTFEYAISGTADDYYAQKLGVASILIELGSSTSAQFSRNQSAMWAMLR